MKNENMKFWKRGIGVICFIVLLFACSHKAKKSSDNMAIEHWQNKQIKLPVENLKNNYSGSSQGAMEMLNKELKVLSIININCPNCVEHIGHWKYFIESIDTSYVGFIFLLNSTDQFVNFNDSIFSKKIGFDYFKDQDSRVCMNNNFSQDYKYQTLLLNKENKAILIGNPTASGAIRDLYRDFIDKYYQKKNIQGVVRGAITTQKGSILRTRFSSRPRYYTVDSVEINKEQADSLVKSLEFVPIVSAQSNSIVIVKRSNVEEYRMKLKRRSIDKSQYNSMKSLQYKK